MPQEQPEQNDNQLQEAARTFFQRARETTETGNFDYAIDMYIEGLHRMPDALNEGHKPLRELALARQAKGGKKPSIVERVKHLRGKTAIEQLLNAEYLLARDPEHIPYAEVMLKAAVAGGYKNTAQWIADLVFQANNACANPSFNTYILLKDSYTAIGQFDRALAACQRAVKIKPEDANLADEFKNLTAELTMARGRYDQEGDFRKAIKDREAQEKLHAQAAVVKTKDYRLKAVEDARKALVQNPNIPKNIFNLAEALSELEQDQADNEAIELLENVYKAKSDFSYKQRAGLIKIKQLKRKIRQAKPDLDSGPSELSSKLNTIELEHYRLCVENYPTDLQAKYEYGIRLMRNKKYDDAIPLFQEAQRDPRHRISAMDKIGMCFFMKDWYIDAIDLFSQAIESYEATDDSIAKELRYNLAKAYEKNGESSKALEIYRKIAQLDFAYKDVRQRIDELRGTGKQN